MLTIFNRKELLVTLSMDRQAEVRNALSANGIDYYVKTTNLESSSIVGSQRAHVGSFGINSAFSYEYKIYVNKKDYEKARHLIG